MKSMNEKMKKLQKAFREIEFKFSNDDVMQYMIAKYITEKIKEVRQRRVEKTFKVNAEKICKYFNFQYSQIENAFYEIKTDFKDLRELEKYSYDLVAEFESYSNEEEIKKRNYFKEVLKQELQEHKDVLSYEVKNLFQEVIKDIDELSYEQFRTVVELLIKYTNVA